MMSKLEKVSESKSNKNIKLGFKCPFCFLNYGDAKSLIVHLTSHNLVTKPENESDEPNSKEVILPACYVRVTRCDYLINHPPKKSSENSSFKLQVKKNQRSKKAKEYVEIKGKGGKLLYGCLMCSMVSRFKCSLRRHFRTHTGKRPYVCKHCNRAFSQSQHLKDHIRRKHIGEKPFTCVHCDRSFCCSSDMKAHVRRKHTGEKPFTCAHCDRSFCTSMELKVHKRVHTGEKPYACKYCSRAFTQLGNWKIHVRIHTGEKPFACQFCKYRCARKQHLKMHYRGFHKLVNWKL